MLIQAKRLFFLIIAVILFTIALNTVIIPYNIIAGGISGLGAIFVYITGKSAAMFIFVVNLIILALAYFFVSPKYAIGSIIGANILTPLCVALIPVGPISDDVLLSTIFGGAITGIGIYFLSVAASSTGGTSVLGRIVSKYTGIAYGTSVSICDLFIVGLGFYFFGLENTLYAIIYIFICTMVANFLERGAQQASVFHIITDDKDLLQKRIINEIARGVTVIDAKGGYNYTDKNVLICVVKYMDVIKIKRIINESDEKAFYYITPASTTYGGFLAKTSK